MMHIFSLKETTGRKPNLLLKKQNAKNSGLAKRVWDVGECFSKLKPVYLKQKKSEPKAVNVMKENISVAPSVKILGLIRSKLACPY